MTSKEKILSAITANKPPLRPLPVLPAEPIDTEPFVKLQKFSAVLQGIGGTSEEIDSVSRVADYKAELIAKGLKVASFSPEAGEGNFNVTPVQTAPELEMVDYAFINATLGVAENGSVWLYESQFVNRLLPFICQHLVIILEKNMVVSDMHEAYRKIDVIKEGYGLFLAGPSKTADIEQSLVIGAHGARSAKIFLI
ncbi:MAG: lactate utilization protein B/C [Chitinophagaceae bacterium]|nr:MAG: lactate utilization protein B/C [Chitinophagaceae bacterium]